MRSRREGGPKNNPDLINRRTADGRATGKMQKPHLSIEKWGLDSAWSLRVVYGCRNGSGQEYTYFKSHLK